MGLCGFRRTEERYTQVCACMCFNTISSFRSWSATVCHSAPVDGVSLLWCVFTSSTFCPGFSSFTLLLSPYNEISVTSLTPSPLASLLAWNWASDLTLPSHQDKRLQKKTHKIYFTVLSTVLLYLNGFCKTGAKRFKRSSNEEQISIIRAAWLIKIHNCGMA